VRSVEGVVGWRDAQRKGGTKLPSPPDMGHLAIDADIESLYRRSPSRAISLTSLLARSLPRSRLSTGGEWVVMALDPHENACSALDSIARSHVCSHRLLRLQHYLGARGRLAARIRARRQRVCDRPRQTWRHHHPGGRYPGSLVT